MHRVGTASQIKTNLTRHVYPRIGDRPIAAIRASEIQAMVKAMTVATNDQKALAAATVEVVYTWVSTIFGAAVADRVLTSSPCRDIRRPEVHRARV